MLNTEKEIRKYTTNCISCLPVVYIVRPNENNGTQVVMIGITEEQEKQLDNNKIVTINTDRGCFTIDPKFCYAYGDLDLSPNSDDINKIAKANWFENFLVNIHVVSTYDYNTHTVTSDIRGGRWFDTYDIKVYLPYLYGCIGKPKRVAIFKEYLNSLMALKAKREAKRLNNKKYRENKTNNIYNKKRTIAKRKAKVSSLKFTLKV